MQLIIPRIGNRQTAIPVTDRVKYLGVVMDLEKLTLEHRIHCAQLACRRLSRWLRSRCFSIQAKLQTWRSCIFNALLFGVLATGFAHHDLAVFQQTCITMLRKIVQDHPQRTRKTNFEAPLPYQQYWPLHLLLKAATKLEQNHRHRIGLTFPH